MAASGIYNSTVNVQEVVTEACSRVGIGWTDQNHHILKEARTSLNLMFVDWANDEINQWAVAQLSGIALTATTATYDLETAFIDVLDISLRRDSKEYPMHRMSYDYYQALTNKSSPGRPTHYHILLSRQPQLITWPVTDVAGDTIQGFGIKQFQRVTAGNQDADMPYRFQEAVAAGLAARLALKKKALTGVAIEIDILRKLTADAMRSKDKAAGADRDRGVLRVQPYAYGRRG